MDVGQSVDSFTQRLVAVVNQTIPLHMTTTWTASNLSMEAFMSTSTSEDSRQIPRSRNIHIMHRIITYWYHRGQEGNRQMARLARKPHKWPESLDCIPSNFGMPIWIVCGDDDHLVSPESCRKLQRLLGGPTIYATFS